MEHEIQSTDAELVRASAHDASAFGKLYERHVRAVYCWLASRGEHVAADLTAETFAQAWLSRRRFHDRRNGLDAASSRLLSLEDQHPDARVSRDPLAYQRAQSRLFPRG